MLKNLVEIKDITLLVSSNDLGHATEVCQRIVVLEKGCVIKDILTSSKTLEELESHFTM